MGLLNPFTCVVLKAYISNLRLHFLIFQENCTSVLNIIFTKTLFN